jgi:translation initiation factor IF-3
VQARITEAAFFVCKLFWRCISIAFKELAINEAITDKEVRLVGPDNSQLGIMPLAEARKIANDQNLDLVRIAPQASPPVCRVMDYGKHRFEQQKREKEARKNQKIVEIKEIRLSANIGDNDFNTKLGHAKRFLQEGNKLKASIRFRGREMAHADRGVQVMRRFAEALEEFGNVEKDPKLEGRSMQMFIAPKAQK